MNFRTVGLFLVLTAAWTGCHGPDAPGVVAFEHLLQVLEAEIQKPAAEQDQALIRSLVAALREELGEGQPALPPGPFVVELEFSFDTRLRVGAKGTFIAATVWPKDLSGDTVKAVGSMKLALRRLSPFPGARGEVLQSWFRDPQSVEDAWQDAWVFKGHYFELYLDEEARSAHSVVLEASYVDPQGREVEVKPPKRKHLKL